MPNYTPNLNLVKPIVTEQYDIAKVTNENADKIDLLLAPKANPTFTGTVVSNNLLVKNQTSPNKQISISINNATDSYDIQAIEQDVGYKTLKLNPIGNVAVNGIKFPAVQVPSEDPNTLDDYEEGTWTPILVAQTGVLTSYTSSGKYIKIGNVVQIEFASQIIDKGTGTDSLQISGLPFAVQNAYAPIVLNEPFNTGWLCRGTLFGTEIISIIKYDNTTVLLIQNGSGFVSNFTYITA